MAKKLAPKKIEIILKPSDFKDCSYTSNNDCALSRAVKRHFKVGDKKNICVHSYDVKVTKGKIDKTYLIKDCFDPDDFYFVKDKYANDPKMLKAYYVVTLIESEN